MHKFTYLLPAVVSSAILIGCASGPSQKALNDSNNLLRGGDTANALRVLEEANKDKKDKDTPYYLDKGEITKFLGVQKLNESTDSLRKADLVVEDWQAKATVNLAKNTGEFLNYLFASIGSNSAYEPKDYEKSLLSYDLALNHVLAGYWDLARIEAKKIAERETLIKRLHEKSEAALKAKEAENKKSNVQSFSRIENINGYPVNLLNSPEVNNLKNSYQNAAAHYLAAFIFEQQSEDGFAAPGYRTALELKPNNGLFELSLAQLDKKIAARNEKHPNSDVLFIVETGNIPRINSHKSTVTFATAQGPKIVTFNLPVIESPSAIFNPGTVSVGSQNVILYQAANLDAMSRRQLKDDMPGYLLKASTQALTQILAQAATQAAVAGKNNNQGAGMLASLLVGAAMSVGSADVRQWSALPGAIYMGRGSVPKGEGKFTVPTPSGPFTVPLQFGQDYQVVHVRILGGRAIVSTMGETTPMSNYKVTKLDIPFDFFNSDLKHTYALK